MKECREMAGAKGRNEMNYMWDNSKRKLSKMQDSIGGE